MVLAEQELGETDDDDYNDNDDSNKSNKDNSLLSMMANRGHYGVKEFNDHLMKCASCADVLPVWYDENVNEQSYCFPDGPTTQKKTTTMRGKKKTRVSICKFITLTFVIPPLYLLFCYHVICYGIVESDYKLYSMITVGIN